MIFRHRLSDLRALLIDCCAALAIAAGTTGICHAQDATASTANASDVAVLKAQLESLQRQFDELKHQINNQSAQPAQVPRDGDVKLDDGAVKRLVDGYLREKEQKRKEEEEAAKAKIDAEGYKVGTDLGMAVRWGQDPGGHPPGLVAETAHKDFYFHVGGRLMEDTVAWTESPLLKSSSFGELQDGTFFRRARIQMEGLAWENMEFNFIWALEQIQQGIPNFDEFWVGYKSLPVIDTVRIGHIKIPQGLEGDEISSSNAMTFLEKSASADAFEPNFGIGIEAADSYFDQHATYQAFFYRQDNATNGNNGADFGDGKYAVTGRLTALPYYSEDGSCFFHLGASATYRKAEDANPGVSGPGIIRFRARPDLRDAIGDFGTTVNGTTLPGNTSRLVDTGAIAADSATVIGTEIWYTHGPFSVQAEWTLAQMNDASVSGAKTGTESFNGGYVQLSYFLTGEHRTYDRRFGRIPTMYFEGPTTPFWLVNAENGGWSWGSGALELAVRYDYLNLNDGPIQGGVMSSTDVALNWYLNQNLKIQLEYADDNRWHDKGQPSGVVQCFGTRVSIAF